MIAGGGAGNFIDRARLSYVVDFIDVRIINYPVFNVADCFVVVGAILFGIYILFYEGKSGNN
jgi:signal peptidase II